MKCRMLICAVLLGVFVLAGGWPEHTAVVADAQDKKEPPKPGKGAEPVPEKDKKGHYAKIEIVGMLRERDILDFRSGIAQPGRVIGKYWTVSTDKLTCRLEFQGNKDFLEFSTQHKGKTVRVTGSCSQERNSDPQHLPYRVIIKVASMDPAAMR